MEDLAPRIVGCVKHFWDVIQAQDAGAGPSADPMKAFKHLAYDMVVEAGLPGFSVSANQSLDRYLPAFFRAEKPWDLVVAHQQSLVAVLEFKYLTGPHYASGYQALVDQLVGGTEDFWQACEEGAFGTKTTPWLGCLFLLEDHPDTQSPVELLTRDFDVFPDFRGSSYAKRHQLLFSKLRWKNRLAAGCLLVSPRGNTGTYTQPHEGLTWENFFTEFEFALKKFMAKV